MVTAPSGRTIAALVILLGLSILLNSVDRGALGVAAPLMKSQLGLSATQFGLAASAFFVTYGALQPVTGWLCDRVSVYRLLAFGVALWALSTMLTGWVSGLTTLVLLRLTLGIGESFAFPSASKIIASHVPAAQRGLASAAIGVGLALGPALGTLAGGAILARSGWRPIFITFGAVTLLWLVPWFLAVRTLPKPVEMVRPAPFAYRALLAQKALWWLGFGQVTANYCFFFMSTWLPLYLVTGRGLSIATMTVFATLTFAVQAVSAIVVGYLSDRLVALGRDEGAVRRGILVATQVALAIGISGLAFATSPAAVLGWLLFTGAAMGCGPGMVYAISQMFAGPRLTGSWVGVQNALASLSGILGPVVTGLIVDASGSYFGAFVFAAAVSALGALLFAFALPPIREIDIA